MISCSECGRNISPRVSIFQIIDGALHYFCSFNCKTRFLEKVGK